MYVVCMMCNVCMYVCMYEVHCARQACMHACIVCGVGYVCVLCMRCTICVCNVCVYVMYACLHSMCVCMSCM